MSFQAYERLEFQSEVYSKLKEAEMEAEENKHAFRYTLHRGLFCNTNTAADSSGQPDFGT